MISRRSALLGWQPAWLPVPPLAQAAPRGLAQRVNALSLRLLAPGGGGGNVAVSGLVADRGDRAAGARARARRRRMAWAALLGRRV